MKTLWWIRKSGLSILVLVAVTAALAGCGGGGDDDIELLPGSGSAPQGGGQAQPALNNSGGLKQPGGANGPTAQKDGLALQGGGQPGGRLPEITPGPEDGVISSGSDGGNTSSDGKSGQGAFAADGQYTVPGSPPGGTGKGDPQPLTVTWLPFQDAQYGFSLMVPDSYFILPEQPGQAQTGAPALKIFRFQDKRLENSELKFREPAKFIVEVYGAPKEGGIAGWLQGKPFMSPGAKVEPVSLMGASEAVHVQLEVMLFPNDYYVFMRGAYLYRVTSGGGDYGQKMFESFALK